MIDGCKCHSTALEGASRDFPNPIAIAGFHRLGLLNSRKQNTNKTADVGCPLPCACVDVNECADQSICGRHAKCVNEVGSFKCSCNAGYQRTGPDCEGRCQH